jgi:hypothetical protein
MVCCRCRRLWSLVEYFPTLTDDGRLAPRPEKERLTRQGFLLSAAWASSLQKYTSRTRIRLKSYVEHCQLLILEVPDVESQSGTLHPTDPRLFVSAAITHALFAILIALAISGGALFFLHRRARKGTKLTAEPGTIAAAVSIGGQTELAQILDGKGLQSSFISQRNRDLD